MNSKTMPVRVAFHLNDEPNYRDSIGVQVLVDNPSRSEFKGIMRKLKGLQSVLEHRRIKHESE